MRGSWIYIVTNQPNGVVYVGVTGNLARRPFEHRDGLLDEFTKRYGLHCLVYVERHEAIVSAIQRETNIKHWPRAWKVRLITPTMTVNGTAPRAPHSIRLSGSSITDLNAASHSAPSAPSTTR